MVGTGNFGKLTQAADPRILQFALKFIFEEATTHRWKRQQWLQALSYVPMTTPPSTEITAPWMKLA